MLFSTPVSEARILPHEGMRFIIRKGLHNIFREIDQNGPGPSRPSYVKRIPYCFGQIVYLFTRKLCLVQGRVIPTMSTSWKASVPIRDVGTCPVKTTIGMESM